MTPHAPSIQYATTDDGIRIAFASFGDGPPIVFASNMFGDLTGYRTGWPHNRDITDRLVALGWRVIRCDVRGMGLSDRDVSDLSLDGRVRDLEAVVAKAGLETFTLIGVDIGAATAIAYAARHTETVSRLVLLSPWPSGRQYLEIPALQVAYAAERLPLEDRTLFGKVLGSVATGFSDPDLLRLGAEAFQQSSTPGELSAFNAATAHIDLREHLPRVVAPTLVIHEPAFPFSAFALCRDVAAAIPGAELVIVADNSIAGRVHDENIAAIHQFLHRAPGLHPSVVPVSGAAVDPAMSTHGLTARELEILRAVARGASNKAIAVQCGVAVSTIERHLANLYGKIKARGRADAIRFALQHRL